MSESAGESGGAPLSDGQFGDGLTETPDLPPGETAQTPGDGIFTPGWYPWYIAQRRGRTSRKKRKRDE